MTECSIALQQAGSHLLLQQFDAHCDLTYIGLLFSVFAADVFFVFLLNCDYSIHYIEY